MQIQSIGKSDGSYTTVPRVIGEDILCLHADVHDREQIRDGVYIPASQHRNDRMMFYRVEKSGINVLDRLGVLDGDYVYVDMLGRFADTFPVSFAPITSVLFKTDSDGRKPIALKGRIIAEVVIPKEKMNEFGFVQLTDLDPYGIVVSIGEGCRDRGFTVGDRISLQQSDDSFTFELGSKTYVEYDYRTPAIKYLGKDGENHAD